MRRSSHATCLQIGLHQNLPGIQNELDHKLDVGYIVSFDGVWRGRDHPHDPIDGASHQH